MQLHQPAAIRKCYVHPPRIRSSAVFQTGHGARGRQHCCHGAVLTAPEQCSSPPDGFITSGMAPVLRASAARSRPPVVLSTSGTMLYPWRGVGRASRRPPVAKDVAGTPLSMWHQRRAAGSLLRWLMAEMACGRTANEAARALKQLLAATAARWLPVHERHHLHADRS